MITESLDFTSSLYLDFRHETRSLRPWSQLTTGRPAALTEPVGSERVARRLASLQGCQQASLARSTLHLVWDLFGILAGERIALFLDAGAYPIIRWGVERAAARGTPVRRFPHRDSVTLCRLLRKGADDRRPVVVSDGLCTVCGCATPIAAYLDCVRSAGGLLVLDDTQALGILGQSPDSGGLYGRDGGGSLRYQNIFGPELLVVTSLAKGFGVPLAALSGQGEMVRQFEALSETRIHCSPPSAADIFAAGHALALNEEVGDARRLQLATRVQQFRRGLAEIGIKAEGGLFPVQTLTPIPDLDARRLYERLLKLGALTVLRRGHNHGQPQISFVITARHRPDEIKRAVHALEQAVSMTPQRQLQTST